ncbi:MAG: ABC transporter transmembrane domain-containing protein [Chthoniobacteraceae bacterium]
MPANTEPKPSYRELAGLLRYIRPWRRRFILAIVASFVSMGFGLMFPYLVGNLLDAAIPSVKVPSLPPWMRDVNRVALFLAGSLAVQAVLTFFSSYSFNKIGESAVVALRRDLYSRLISLPMRFFGEHRVGELSSRLSNDLSQIHDTLTFTFAQAIRQTMLLVGGVALIAATSLRLSLVMISSFPVLILLGVLFGRRIRKLSRTAQDRLAETATIVEETLQGIANVKAFGNEQHETRRYAAGLDGFLAIVLKSARLRAGLISFIIVGIFGSIVLVMWYGARLMQAGVLTHGELTRFVLYTIFVGGSVSSFAEIFTQIQKTLGATQRVRELLAEETEEGFQISDFRFQISEPASVASSSNQKSEIRNLKSSPRLSGAVTFDRVSFRYPSRPDLPVLRELSLEARSGERIALVGPSGAGKSTIVSLLLRFYEPESGRILFDGRSAADFDLRTVRRNMAIVPQEVLLFGGSIRENIAYGRPGASDDEIRHAAARAHCVEFIDRFPEGMETLVGERGVKLSGGQRQRIAIARALLRDPAILILDEATSSLDSESEQLIQSALTALLENRTAFIVAHRLSTIRQCDRIYVIESGAVTESGTHEELIVREGGTYRRLAELQFTS